MTSQVRVEERDNIAWVTIDCPPLNASSTAVQRGLMEAAQMVAEMTVSAAVLRCAGATLVLGADLNEFDAAPAEPHLPDIVKAVEDCPTSCCVSGTRPNFCSRTDQGRFGKRRGT